MDLHTTLVCNKWPLVLQSGQGGHYAFLDTVSSRNASCFLRLVANLPQGQTVVEHFGGVGIFSTVVQQVLAPRSHLIFDLDADCIKQVQSAFAGNPTVYTEQSDAHQTMATIPGEVIICDFPVHTFKTHAEWPWEQMCAFHPQTLFWSDTALRRLGLHRALYSRLFGVPIVDHQDYTRAYSRYMWEHYGYSIVASAFHVYSYMRAEPVPYRDAIEFTRISKDM